MLLCENEVTLDLLYVSTSYHHQVTDAIKNSGAGYLDITYDNCGNTRSLPVTQ